jgi:LPXTG-motif cell wall-anchored protein
MPVTRKRKVEVARLAGFGLVLAGVLALVLAVLSAQNAGASNPTAQPRQLSCHSSGTDQIGWAVMYGACSSTTADYTPSSVPDYQCGCNTTTTYVTTTTQEHHCGCSTTTSESTTTESSTTESTTSTTMGTGPTESSTSGSTTSSTMGTGPTESTTPVTGQGGGTPVTTSPTTGQAGVTATLGPQANESSTVAAAAAAEQLPFTGSSALALAGFGILLILSGAALALRKRRLAR